MGPVGGVCVWVCVWGGGVGCVWGVWVCVCVCVCVCMMMVCGCLCGVGVEGGGVCVYVFSQCRTKGLLPRRARTYCCTRQVPTLKRWGVLTIKKKMQMSSEEPFYLYLPLKAPRLPKCEKNIHNFGQKTSYLPY